MLDEQAFFEEFLKRQGRRLELGIRTTNQKLQGVVSNTMFDSILLTTQSGPQIVRFDQILYVRELD